MTALPTPEQKTPENIGAKVRSAMAWNMVSMVLTQVAMSGIFILLASRLDPHVFGVFGLAAVFVDFFYQQGSTAAVDAALQRQDFKRRTLSSYFWASMLVMSVVTALLVGGSQVLAVSIKEPDLLPVLIALALTLLPMSLIVPPLALMRQKMDFRGIAVRNIAASLAGGVAALAIAFSPFAEWALVVQRWVSVMTSVVILLWHSRAFPTLELDRKLGLSYLNSVTRIFVAQGICGAVPRVIDLIVAVFFGTVLLGCLRVASKLVEVVVAALVNPIGQMVVVLVSKAGDALDHRRHIFLQLSKMTAAICLPGFAGVALVSGDFTKLALQPDYAPVANMLAILCLLGLMIPVTNFRNSLLTSLNRLNSLVWFAALDLVVVVGAMLAVQRWGVNAVLIASGMPNITSLIFAMPFVMRLMATRKRELALAVAPPYLATMLMVAGVLAIAYLAPASEPLTNLVQKAVVGAVIYIGFLFLFFRDWTLTVIRDLKNR